MTRLYLDLETRSRVDLKEAGTHRYAEDPSTEIIGFSYAFDDETPQWVEVHSGSVPSMRVYGHIADGGEVWAHNAEFDRTLWNAALPRQVGNIAPISIPQTRCTMASCRAMGLPGSLGGAAEALGLPQKKDWEGHKLMMSLCKPTTNGTFLEDPAAIAKLGKYCNQDIRTLREVAKRVLPLSTRELEIYHTDQQLNDRGVLIDQQLATKAQRVYEIESLRLNLEIRRLTRNEVAGGNCHVALKRWLQDHFVPVDGVDQNEVRGALALPDLPEHCRAVLQARHDIGKSSLAKISAFLTMVSGDGRLRGNLNYAGAGQTLRWSGKGVQLHNLPRPELAAEHVRPAIDALIALSAEEWIQVCAVSWGNPLNVLADCLRGILVPGSHGTLGPLGSRPVLTIHDEILLELGGCFVALDYAQVEARALVHLAGHQEDLEVFRSNGPIYELRAARIFGIPVSAVKKNSRERHIAKETVLGCGYGMGPGKFQTYLGSKGLHVTQGEARKIVSGWRNDHPEVTHWWEELKVAAFAALDNPGVAQAVKGRVSFLASGSFLFCTLPSGRHTCYPYPRLEPKRAPWGAEVLALTYMVWRQKKWQRDSTFGGKLAENIVQGYCRDLLADALVRFEKERPTGSVEDLELFMARLPSWATGMPMKVEGWSDVRYRK